jgi:hypothetical protein
MIPSWRGSLVVALLVGAVVPGAFGAAPVRADADPLVPVVIVPIVPVTPGISSIVPPVVGGTTERSRNGMIWSTRGRADVDVDIDRQHGRTVVP